MQNPPAKLLFAAILSMAMHAAVLVALGIPRATPIRTPETPPEPSAVQVVLVPPPPPAPSEPAAAPATAAPEPPVHVAPPDPAALQARYRAEPSEAGAYMDAPPAPTAAEWAAAASYTLKNSKRYRYTWGQQVRSMMGTAYEGVDQGVVRFRVEIAPDGTLANLQTLWSTSDKAEALARLAIASMPPLPPTPTGKPLVFEKTISFQPFASDDQPIYRYDCEPDPPAFHNPFVWDGGQKSPPVASPAADTAGSTEDHSPRSQQALEDCLQQLPQDTPEAEADHDQRLLKQWRSSSLGQ